MFGALIAIYLIWGMNWLVMKIANDYFPPTLFVTYRFIVGALVLMFVTSLIKRESPKKSLWGWIVITGILQYAATNVAAQIGMLSLSAGMVAMLYYTMPLWVAILAHFLLAETLTRRKLIGIGISMVGMAMLMGVQSGSAEAILITISGAVAWAVASVLIKLKFSREDMIQIATWQMVAGALFLMGYTVLFERGQIIWSTSALLCVLYSGVLASAVAFFLWNWLLVHIEAGKAAVAVLAVPVIGVISGIIFLQEEMTLSIAIGMLLIFIGIYTVTKKQAFSHLPDKS